MVSKIEPADLSTTLSQELGHEAYTVAKWIFTDLQERDRQNELRESASKEMRVDISTSSIQQIFKEAQWGEILHFLCVASDEEATDFNALLIQIMNYREQPLKPGLLAQPTLNCTHRRFVSNELLDWVFKEAFVRQDIDETGDMDVDELRSLTVYLSFTGQLEICEATLDAALSTVEGRYDCDRAIVWFKSHVYGGYGWMDKDGNIAHGVCMLRTHAQFVLHAQTWGNHDAFQGLTGTCGACCRRR